METPEPSKKNNKKKSTSNDKDSGNAPGTASKRQSVSRDDAAVISELKSLYKTKLLPIEKKYLFQKFNGSEILDAELAAKPAILLVGQYSTGKTTFIKHLIGMEYPEMHIGPEPTTDRFFSVVHGPEAKIIQGNALTGINELPYSGLSVFGSSFLNRFNAAVVPSPFLKDVNIIDTPGVLSGEKQRTARGYDFAKVCRWFAERSDLILLLFDCSKLDISDEFKSVIEELQPQEDKIHCVLNKADQLDQESLMRVYGALLWNMGRIFRGAEVTRIYVGSFHDEPLLRAEHKTLFDRDELALKSYIASLPKACAMRKINEMVKRLRYIVVHICILGYLRSKLPYLWGKEKIQQTLLEHLPVVFTDVRLRYALAEGDFPKLDEYRASLSLADFGTFPALDRRALDTIQDMLSKDIPRISSLVANVSAHLPGSLTGTGIDNEEEVDSGNTEDDRRIPHMFKYHETSHETLLSGKSVGMLLVAVGGMLALVVALVVASWNEEERALYRQFLLDFVHHLLPHHHHSN